MEVHKFVEKGKTKKISHSDYSTYAAYPVFVEMQHANIGGAFRVNLQDMHALIIPTDHVSMFKSGEPKLVFMNSHKGIVSFEPKDFPVLKEISSKMIEYQLKEFNRGMKAGKKLGGKIGEIKLDGIRYTTTLNHEQQGLNIRRVADKEAVQALEGKEPLTTYKSMDGIEFIKLENGDVIDKPIYDILTKYLGE